jgi:peptidoglycan/LPS O-acetylase OafA/YrhL
LRWWAAFAVFLFHMRVFAPLPEPLSTLFTQGYLGVTFFFVLSGFVLTWSARPGVPQSTFYGRRFARIYPAHVVALLLAIPVFYSLVPVAGVDWLKPFDPAVLALSFVLLQGWWLNPVILFSGNPAAWTLTCEAFFYALHPYVSKVLQPLAQRGALIITVVALAVPLVFRASVLAFPGSWLSQVPTPVVHFPEFIAGMALAWAIRSGWRLRVPPAIALSLLVLVVVGIAVASDLGAELPTLLVIAAFGNEAFAIACVLAIASIAQRTLAGRRSVWESRTQVKLGEWSFTFYLVHATLIYLALRIIGPQPPAWRNIVWFAVLLVAGLLVACALHAFVERPFERRMRRWKDRRDVRLSEAAVATP